MSKIEAGKTYISVFYDHPLNQIVPRPPIFVHATNAFYAYCSHVGIEPRKIFEIDLGYMSQAYELIEDNDE